MTLLPEAATNVADLLELGCKTHSSFIRPSFDVKRVGSGGSARRQPGSLRRGRYRIEVGEDLLDHDRILELSAAMPLLR